MLPLPEAIVGASFESFSKSSRCMPEFVPMMRSGASDAIFSNAKPSVAFRTVGFASPRAFRAHGQTASGWSPYHSVTAIGL